MCAVCEKTNTTLPSAAGDWLVPQFYILITRVVIPLEDSKILWLVMAMIRL
jgi:hypothetical protein